jgi:N-acetyl-gamma-glutamyl-phosphate reductase
VNLINLCATKNLGKKINFFDRRIKKNLPKITSVKNIKWKNIDLVFLSMPNGEAQKLIKKLFFKNINLKFIDLSADFRISDKRIFEKNYKIKHKAANLIKRSLYSIPELSNKNISQYRIISNPGCYPTSIQIPLIPLIKKKLINTKNITIDSKSGYSGAGKNLEKKFTHKNLYKSTFAYNPKNHRHVCEIDEQLFKFTKKKINYTFNPHLLPTFRGILTAIYVYIKKGTNAKIIRNALKEYYNKSNFIKILKLNSSLGSGNVLNTNNCELSICETRIKNKIIIFSALDNLVKGASGQAIQNMNILYGFPENLGLK